MLEDLSGGVQGALGKLRGRKRLSTADVDEAMREIRLALLEADANLAVTRAFVKRARERCVGSEVIGAVNPGDKVAAIVAEELAVLMGGASRQLELPQGLGVVMLAGLQGAGKTTAAGKLAQLYKQQHGSRVLLAACDTRRPAAAEQLTLLAQQAGAEVISGSADESPAAVAKRARKEAADQGIDLLVVDTGGRQHADADLMRELEEIGKAAKPDATLLVVDAMTGQEAASVASTFAASVKLDGALLTKLDGDARGGAALSIAAVSGTPILFASTGERLADLDTFHPDRMASRILGMGDVRTFVEQAERQVDEEQALRLEQKIADEQFSLEDFLEQLRTIRKMGPLSSLLGMMPGVSADALAGADLDERNVDRVEAIVLSMTTAERRAPDIINQSRQKRIAAGSGTTPKDVSQLLKQFDQMRQMLSSLGKGGLGSIGKLLGGKGGLAGLSGLPGATAGGPPALPPGLQMPRTSPSAKRKRPKRR